MWLLQTNPTPDVGFWHLLQTDNKEWFLDKSNQRQIQEGQKNPFQKLSVSENIENFEELGETAKKTEKAISCLGIFKKRRHQGVGGSLIN